MTTASHYGIIIAGVLLWTGMLAWTVHTTPAKDTGAAEATDEVQREQLVLQRDIATNMKLLADMLSAVVMMYNKRLPDLDLVLCRDKCQTLGFASDHVSACIKECMSHTLYPETFAATLHRSCAAKKEACRASDSDECEPAFVECVQGV